MNFQPRRWCNLLALGGLAIALCISPRAVFADDKAPTADKPAEKPNPKIDLADGKIVLDRAGLLGSQDAARPLHRA